MDREREFEQLLFEMLDGEWNANKQQRLDELLCNSDARARYRELMAIHAMLDFEICGSYYAINFNSTPFRPHIMQTASRFKKISEV